jgi:hypothetical protein
MSADQIREQNLPVTKWRKFMQDGKIVQSKTDSTRSTNDAQPTESNTQTTRRIFLKAAGIGAAALNANALIPGGLVQNAAAVEVSPFVRHPQQRARDLRELRGDLGRAAGDALVDSEPHRTNGDEETYAGSHFEGNFSKTFPLDANGLVNPNDYRKLIAAAAAGTQAAFDAIPAGGPATMLGPLSPLVLQIEGADSPTGGKAFVPPSINSAGAAAEMVELYWEAFLRDVPFIQYGSNNLVAQAVADINRLSAFAGPRPVTPQNLFRYPFVDVAVGPYVSQILYQSHNLDGVDFVPRLHTLAQVSDPDTGQVLTGPGTGVDFMSSLPEYLVIERGNGPLSPNVDDPTPRFIRSARDMGNVVFRSEGSTYSNYLRAAIILADLGISLDPNSPYANDRRISGFSTFRTAWVESLLGNVNKAEASAFYSKWYIHRKLRPEQFGNLVDGVVGKRFTLTPNLHRDLLNSSVLPLIFEYNRQLNVKRGMGTTGSFLLPQVPNTGSPIHPDPPGGHAFTAGACVTILKAVFDVGTPDHPKPWPVAPVQASADGLNLVSTGDTNLTLLGELNKLAANFAEGRNMLGIHTRVGANMLGLTLGEEVAISVLQEHANTYAETFSGWTLTKFDGNTITFGGNS